MTDEPDRFERALAYAARLHRAQRRKGTRVPYVSHLMAVSALVMESGGDEDAAIAALLHDAAEDQGGRETLEEIRTLFGPVVASVVEQCTDTFESPKPPWRPRKEAYLASIPTKDDRALLVTAADKLHNARSILEDHRQHGARVWGRFTGGREGTLWYQRALAGALAGRAPSRLTGELARVVDELEAEARRER